MIPEYNAPPLMHQIAMPLDKTPQEEQIPCRKPRYQFDYKIHLAIKKDMWIQRMQWVSKNMPYMSNYGFAKSISVQILPLKLIRPW